MNKKNKKPLGYIELETGTKEIFAMNDVFLNYMFKHQTTWETLRLIINIFLSEYICLNSDKEPLPILIKGDIEVTTQHEYFLDVKRTTRIQDIRLRYEPGVTYIEFHNRSNTIPPVIRKAIEYFSLGIAHSEGKMANQIWLLSEDVKELLHGEAFTNYILKDIITDNTYPNNSTIMFVSLRTLSKADNITGELARFLLGEEIEPAHEEVKNIIENFDTLFNDFKHDKEVQVVMTTRERFTHQGFEDGIISIAKNAIAMGLPLEQIAELTGLDVETIERLYEDFEMALA